MPAPAPGRTVLAIDECLEVLEDEGERLAAVAAGVRLDAPVPGCPGWDLDALVRHTGDVHRWATTIVRERRQERLRRDFIGPAGTDALLAWYRDGLAGLLLALSTASPEGVWWTWGPAPNALAFWARRQAQETAVHRWDAEQAAGVEPSPFASRAAADGIDEWLMLASARVSVPDGRGRTLAVAPADAPDRWVVGLGADGLTVERAAAEASCSLHGTASDLFALLMNRGGTDRVDVGGDAHVLRAWREHVRFI